MAKVIIKVNVAYPGHFVKTLETQAAARSKAGERGFTTAVDASTHNLAYAICDWNSVLSARAFWDSPEAKVQMADWKSVVPAAITVLRENPED